MNLTKCCAAGLIGWVFLLTQTRAADWVNPLGGNFITEENWAFLEVPGVDDDANFLLVGNYVVAFPFFSESANVNVQNGNVTFSIPITPAMGEYSIEALFVGLGGMPIDNPPPASLTIEGGRVSAATVVEIYKGATLGGDGALFSFGPTIYRGGRLTGTLDVVGSTTWNEGTIAPGDGVGLLTLTSDFVQTSSGVLEIEVGGTTPVTQHDQLIVSGAVLLAGNLRVPFVNSYTPSMGHSILLLESEMPTGKFDSLTLPWLEGSLAAEVTYGPTGVTLSFVQALPAPFNSAALNSPPTPNYWGNNDFWFGTVPTSRNSVALVNQTPGPRSIELNAGVAGSETAFVDQITIAGNTHAMNLVVPLDTDFTAVKSMNVGNLGVLTLTGGEVHSNRVNILPGGIVRGNGTIDGDLVVGTNSGTVQAELSPGLSPGTTTVTGNLTVNANGKLTIEIEDASSFDKVKVSQTAHLGGTLVVDVSGLTGSIEGIEFEVLIAGLGIGDTEFDEVRTIEAPNANEIYLAPTYLGSKVLLQSYLIGDMDRKNGLDPADGPAFAMAMVDPIAYKKMTGIYGDQSGDIDGNNVFDFDDIVAFVAIHPDFLSVEEIKTLIANYGAIVPEPSTALMLITATTSGLLKRRARLCSF